MNAENFTYWLKGYLELSSKNEGFSPEQVKIIEDHLNLVMNKVTPNYVSTSTRPGLADPWTPLPTTIC